MAEFDVFRLSSVNAAAVARLYGDSYCQLSAQYKAPEEMAFYTPAYFEAKVQKFLQEKQSHIYVLEQLGKPLGFVRYSGIPAAYCQPGLDLVVQPETGVLDGVRYHFDREIEFSEPTPMDKKTLMLNQIYLAPNTQKQGLGCVLLNATLPLLSGRFSNIIVEYNTDNAYARRFYEGLGFKQVAQTFDLDHIIKGKRYFSRVGIGHAAMDTIVTRLGTWSVGRHTAKLRQEAHRGRQHAE